MNADELVRMRQRLLGIDGAIAKLPLERTRSEPRYVRGGEGLHEVLKSVGIDHDNYVRAGSRMWDAA